MKLRDWQDRLRYAPPPEVRRAVVLDAPAVSLPSERSLMPMLELGVKVKLGGTPDILFGPEEAAMLAKQAREVSNMSAHSSHNVATDEVTFTFWEETDSDMAIIPAKVLDLNGNILSLQMYFHYGTESECLKLVGKPINRIEPWAEAVKRDLVTRRGWPQGSVLKYDIGPDALRGVVVWNGEDPRWLQPHERPFSLEIDGSQMNLSLPSFPDASVIIPNKVFPTGWPLGS